MHAARVAVVAQEGQIAAPGPRDLVGLVQVARVVAVAHGPRHASSCAFRHLLLLELTAWKKRQNVWVVENNVTQVNIR